jgi:hypothetical protein
MLKLRIEYTFTNPAGVRFGLAVEHDADIPADATRDQVVAELGKLAEADRRGRRSYYKSILLSFFRNWGSPALAGPETTLDQMSQMSAISHDLLDPVRVA